MEIGENNATKPKWLRKLERESWQPELIISGAAIIGSLQLPGLLEEMQRYAILNFDRDSLFIFYIAFVYWRLFSAALIISFIFHFVIRALWIGLVGLNSVYPGGFKANERFSEHFQEQLREEFGDVDGLIGRLDRLASGVFGISFGIAGVFLNFGLLGLVLVFVHSWLVAAGLTPGQVLLLYVILLVPFLVLSVLSSVLNVKRLRDSDFARKYHYPIASWISRLSYWLGRRYITTSLNLVTSYYADKKSFGWGFLGVMVVMILVGMVYGISDRNISFLIDDVYHRMANDSTRVFPGDRVGDGYDGIYYRPQLPAPGDITGDELTVWIPLPDRELTILEDSCSLPEPDDNLPRDEHRQLNRKRVLDCAREYITLALNGEVITAYDILQQSRVNASGNQYGVRLSVLYPPLRTGQNMLSVTTRYAREDTGGFREAHVPFTFTGKRAAYGDRGGGARVR
jgi:hypothetical protein